jgi:membrane protease YdiL (CAAX protease family)
MAILLGLTLFPVALWNIYIMPPPEKWLLEFTKFFQAQLDAMGLPVVLLLIAILPGICEEFIFRGLILSGLRKDMSDRKAIMLQAFLFGIIHFSPYRLIPTAVLGGVLGWVRVRTGSIFPCMILHAVNNALAMTLLDTFADIGDPLSSGASAFPIAAMGSVITLAVLFLFYKLKPEWLDSKKTATQ